MKNYLFIARQQTGDLQGYILRKKPVNKNFIRTNHTSEIWVNANTLQ